MFKLFREPTADEDVVIGADPADGGSDYCAAVAKSKKHADTFMNFKARMESSQFGYELNKMGLFIKSKTGRFPLIGVERNTGAATIYVLQTLNYPHLFRMRTFDTTENKESDRIGWVTNSQTRPKMLDDLSLSVKQRVNNIYDIEEIKQLMGFIRHPRTGKPQAVSGNHDDFVIAEAIAWQLYTVAKAVTPEALSQKANEFKPLDLPNFVRR